MIYIVHGSNFAKTRLQVANQQKKLGIPQRVEVSINDVTPQQLLSECSKLSLFGTNPFVVLDISALGNKSASKYIEAIKKIPSDSTLVILADKPLSKRNPFIKNLDARVIENELVAESNVFRFLDALYSKNRRATYKELRKLHEEKDAFYIMAMIPHELRNIAYVSLGENEKEKKMAPYTRSKAKKHAVNFTEDSILSLFDTFYSLDRALKLGEVSADLAVTLAVEKVLNSS